MTGRRWAVVIGVLLSVAGFIAPSRASAQCVSYPTAPPPSQFTMHCDPGPDTMSTHAVRTQSYVITNVSGSAIDFNFSTTCTGLTNCSIYPSWGLTIQPGDSARLAITYTTSGTTGTVSPKLNISAYVSLGYWVYAWVARQTYVSDRVTLTPGRALLSYQAPALSPTNHFAVSYAHSTVPYVTQDAPRSVTLVHTSTRAALMPFIGVDLTTTANTLSITSVDLTATRVVGGSNLSFINGETTLHFAGPIRGDSTSYDTMCGDDSGIPLSDCLATVHGDSLAQLYGQVDLRSETSGILPITLTAVVHYSDGTSTTRTLSTRLLLVNTGSSTALPKGWEVAGVQRLYTGGTGQGYMIAEGGGALTWFPDTTSTNNVASDYSKLTASGGTYTRTYVDGTKAVFNSTGFQTSLINRLGDTVRYEYDGSNRLHYIKDPIYLYRGGTGRYLQLNYDLSSGYLSSVTDSGGTGVRQTNYTVSSGNLTRIADPDNAHTDFTYDSDHRLKTVTDRVGNVAHGFAYHASGLVIADTVASVPIDDGSGGTNPGRPVVTYVPWLNAGVPRSATSPTAFPLVKSDTVADLVKDPLNRTTRYRTDPWGQPAMVRNPRGDSTVITRLGLFPRTIRGVDGAIDSLTYANGLLTAARPAGGAWTNYQYGVFGQWNYQSGDDVRYIQRYLQSATGRVDSVLTARLDGTGNSVNTMASLKYDSWNRMVSTRDGSGHRDSTAYDATTGNVNWHRTEGNVVAIKTFDAYGRVVTDSVLGQPKTTYTYDAMNRVTDVNDGVNSTATHFTYNALFRTNVTNPKGEVAEKVDVDALGRVMKRYDVHDTTASQQQTFRYNAAGELTSTTDRRGNRVERRYDAAGNLASRRYGSSLATVDTFTVAYGGNATTTTANNALATVNQTVNRVTRQRVEQSQVGSYFPTKVTHGTGHVLGGEDTVNVQQMISPTAGSLVEYWRTHENAYTGLPEWIEWNGNSSYRHHYYGYTLDDRPLNTDLGTLSYTSRGGVTALSASGGLGYAFQYDTLNRVRAWTGGPNSQSTAYVYDGLGRITADSTATSSPYTSPGVPDSAFGVVGRYSAPTVTSFAYDAAGNRTDHSAVVTVGNRLAKFNGDTLEFDADGNVTRRYNSGSGRDIRYRWDELGRLITVRNAGTNDSVQYAYDALDRLTRRTKNGTVNQYWAWDAERLVAEFDGTMTTVRAAYLYTDTDQPVLAHVPTTAGVVLQAQVDARGSVVGWRSLGVGTAFQTATYDAWGVPTISGDTAPTLLWKGLHWEGGSAYGGSTHGLYYMRARWYDPELGRFLSEDPAGIRGGLNLYVFGHNDPINSSDPRGSDPSCRDRVRDLRRRVNEIQDRVDDYLRSAARGINDQNHLQKIQEEIQGFNNDLDAYHRSGCDDDDDDFRNIKQQGVSLERMPLPSPSMRYGPPRNYWGTTDNFWNDALHSPIWLSDQPTNTGVAPWYPQSNANNARTSPAGIKLPTVAETNAIGLTGTLLLIGSIASRVIVAIW